MWNETGTFRPKFRRKSGTDRDLKWDENCSVLFRFLNWYGMFRPFRAKRNGIDNLGHECFCLQPGYWSEWVTGPGWLYPVRPGPYSGVGSSPIKKGRKNGSGLSLKSSQPKLLLLECVEQNTLLCLLLVSYFSFVLISDQTSPFWYQKIPEMFEDLWELVFCFIFFFAYCFFLLYA
jgi:hypothetical protein